MTLIRLSHQAPQIAMNLNPLIRSHTYFANTVDQAVTAIQYTLPILQTKFHNKFFKKFHICNYHYYRTLIQNWKDFYFLFYMKI